MGDGLLQYSVRLRPRLAKKQVSNFPPNNLTTTTTAETGSPPLKVTRIRLERGFSGVQVFKVFISIPSNPLLSLSVYILLSALVSFSFFLRSKHFKSVSVYDRSSFCVSPSICLTHIQDHVRRRSPRRRSHCSFPHWRRRGEKNKSHRK